MASNKPSRQRPSASTPPVSPPYRPTTHPRTASPASTRGTSTAAPPNAFLEQQEPQLLAPLILVVHDELTVGDAGIRALAACPDIYVHEGELVRLVPAQGSAVPLGLRPLTWRIESLPAPRLRELLSRYARWAVPQSEDPTDAKPTPVPAWVVPSQNPGSKIQRLPPPPAGISTA